MTAPAAPARSARPRAIVVGSEPALAQYIPWLVFLLATLVYLGTISNGFVLDDNGIIERNDVVHHVSGMWRAFVTQYWPNGAGQFRPLVIASFSAEWAAWGANPVGFHVVNVLWHALASVLVYAFARRWLSFGGATVAALVFAVHPVHVEAVANVVGRAELMAACGVLAMLILHARRSPWAIAAFAFALFSKEHAIVAPVLAACLDLAERRTSRDARAEDAPAPAHALRNIYLGYLGVVMVWGAIVFALFRNGGFAAVEPLWETLSAPARWLTMLGVVPVWIRLWFFPRDLSADYTPREIEAWPANAPLALLGAGMLAIALVLAVMLVRRSRTGAIAIAWLVITMGPIANILIPTGVIVAERTLYLSSVGIAVLIGLGAEWLAARRYVFTLVAAAAIVVAGGARSWTRAAVWRSNQSLFVTTAEQHPFGTWTHVALARVFSSHGGYAEAAEEYRKALSLFDGRRVVWAEAIQAAGRANNVALADSLAAAGSARFPGDFEIGLAYGTFSVNQRRNDAALRIARGLTAAQPDSAAAWLLIGFVWVALDERDSARTALGHVNVQHPLRRTADSLLATLPPHQQ